MKSIQRLLLFTLTLLILVISEAGCGSAGSSSNSTGNNDGSGSPPASSSTPQAVQGQWTFTSTANGMEAVISANITNSGNNTFSATSGNVAICPIQSPSEQPAQIAESPGYASCDISEASLNGTITPSTNTVSISISNIKFEYMNVETATLTGTYTSNTSAITAMQGTFSTSSQDSPMTGGNWTGQSNTSFTGTYGGTVNYLNGSVPINVTLDVSQNANYQVTGTIMVSGDPCYAGWTFSGSVIGGGFGAVNDSGSVAVGAIQTSSSGILFGYKSINGCSTAGIGVLATSTQAQAVQVTEAQKAMLNKVLNALQAKAKGKIAEKQRELLRRELQIFP